MQKVGDEGLELWEGDVFDLFRVNGKDVVARLFEIGQFGPNGLVDATTDAIASDCRFEDFFGDDYGKALFAAGVLIEGQRYFGLADGPTMFVGKANAATRMKPISF